MDVKYCLKTQIVDECNLNCKGCDHFAPLAKKWHQPLDDFIKMMKSLIFQMHLSLMMKRKLINCFRKPKLFQEMNLLNCYLNVTALLEIMTNCLRKLLLMKLVKSCL